MTTRVAAALALDETHVEHTAAALARLVEEMARTVVSRTDTASTGAADLAARIVPSLAGLSWREADELLAAHPDIGASAVASSGSGTTDDDREGRA